MFSISQAHNSIDPILVNDPVILRAAQLADHAAWAALRTESRDHLIRWEDDWAPAHLSLSAFRRRLRLLDRQARRGAGLSLLVFRRRDERLVGGATLSNIRYGPSQSAVLGYWIGAGHLRRGYGRAAVRAMLDHGFSALGLNRIEAACQPENVASQSLLISCGFRFEGVAREYLRINQIWRDHEIYAATAREAGGDPRR